MQHWIPVALLALLTASVALADTVTVFRVVAPDGTVTYQDQPPKQGTGEAVEAREIDPDANVVPVDQFPTDAESTTPTRPGVDEQPAAPSVKPPPLPRDALVKGAAAAEASVPAAVPPPPGAPPPPVAPPAPVIPPAPPPSISPAFRGP